jgi:hypothetical protein
LEELNFFREGWKHIVSRDALDHQLFILALAALYTLKNWKPVLILVTAFTIGHSITLALSAFRILNIDSDLVETLIPVTIAVTALSNFFHKGEQVRNMQLNYGLALFFGFIHGLGFANFIRFTLAEGQQIGWPLLQFNLGLEAGQIVFVVLFLCLASLAVHGLGLRQRWWTWAISAGVFVFAVKMIIERVSN